MEEKKWYQQKVKEVESKLETNIEKIQFDNFDDKDI